MKEILSLSPGTMSKWMMAGVLSPVLARVSGSQADLRRKPSCVALAHAFVDGLADVHALDTQVLAHLHEEDGQARILAQGQPVSSASS
jgi:hypothetical protein